MARAEQTFDRLAQAKLSESDRASGRRNCRVIRRRFAWPARRVLPPSIQMYKIRHHGDFHLGQILVRSATTSLSSILKANRDAAFRAADEGAGGSRRRRADQIDRLFRDLGVIERVLKTGADDGWTIDGGPVGMARRGDADLSRRLSRGDVRRAALAETRTTADRMLQFLPLEKALYEIDYELAHRPDWLRVRWAAHCGSCRNTGANRHDRTVCRSPRHR